MDRWGARVHGSGCICIVLECRIGSTVFRMVVTVSGWKEFKIQRYYLPFHTHNFLLRLRRENVAFSSRSAVVLWLHSAGSIAYFLPFKSVFWALYCACFSWIFVMNTQDILWEVRTEFLYVLFKKDIGLQMYKNYEKITCLFCLRRRSAAARLLRSWVQIPPGHGGLSVVSVVCCQVEVSATSWSLVQRSPTDCGASLCVI